MPGRLMGHTARKKLAVNDRTTLPVLELHGPQTMTNPPVETPHNPKRNGTKGARHSWAD